MRNLETINSKPIRDRTKTVPSSIPFTSSVKLKTKYQQRVWEGQTMHAEAKTTPHHCPLAATRAHEGKDASRVEIKIAHKDDNCGWVLSPINKKK